MKLIHVASLNRVKDQPTLLEALRIAKASGAIFDMRVIGFDTLGGEIQRLAGRLGLADQVHFLGPLRYEALRAHYEWADLLVMASRHEAGPLVMLEAALAGVPTLGTRVGHIADQAPHAAIAVPIADPAAMAEALIKLAADEPRRLRLAHSAQAFAVARDAGFTVRTFTKLYEALVQDAIA